MNALKTRQLDHAGETTKGISYCPENLRTLEDICRNLYSNENLTEKRSQALAGLLM